ncbi:MAG: glycosyltransferase [Calditrichota bacterium]
MNIFYFDSERNLGGVERWMFTSGSHLKERGHNVYFGGRPNSLFLERCESMELSTFSIDVKSDFGPKAIFQLAKLFRRLKIDVIVTNLNKDTRLAGIARKFAGKNVLVGRNGLPILKNNLTYRLTYPWLASGIIMPNNLIKHQYLEFGWVPEEMMRVVHNGISADKSIDYNHAETRKAHNIPMDAMIVGIFGRLVPQKQHKQFLEVAKGICEKRDDVRFIIAGDGPLRDEIEAYAVSLGIQDKVFMLGFQKEVMAFYTLCDIVIQTSEHEGLPNVVLEAMFAGKPVVSFDVGGTREMITSPEMGIVYDERSIPKMTETVLELLDNPERRKNIGQAARRQILENFTVERMVNNVETFFQELLKKNS